MLLRLKQNTQMFSNGREIHTATEIPEIRTSRILCYVILVEHLIYIVNKSNYLYSINMSQMNKESRDP